MTLSKVEKTISSKTGGYDIKVTSRSKVSAPKRQLQFRFEEPKLNKTVTIKEARSGLNPFQKVIYTFPLILWLPFFNHLFINI